MTNSKSCRLSKDWEELHNSTENKVTLFGGNYLFGDGYTTVKTHEPLGMKTGTGHGREGAPGSVSPGEVVLSWAACPAPHKGRGLSLYGRWGWGRRISVAFQKAYSLL